MTNYTDRAPDGTYLREEDGLDDDTGEDCVCPAGYRHEEGCPVAYWPAGVTGKETG